MIKQTYILLLIVLTLSVQSCDDIFGSKDNGTTDEIFEEGRIDPLAAEETVGYAALVPFWTGFNEPTDITVGWDEIVYVTDSAGLHVLDRAGREFNFIPLRGATAVAQDRNLFIYVAARQNVVVPLVDDETEWDLSVIYKIDKANLAGGAQPVFIDTLIHPFMDGSRGNSALQTFRLVKDSPNSDELVEITDLTVLADNTLYATRRGPLNNRSSIQSPDNTVLEFERIVISGERSEQMTNVRQITALNPITPSLSSVIGPEAIQAFLGPPQRDFINPDRSFLIAQADPNVDVPFRVLWISAVETTDGLFFLPNTSLLPAPDDTAEANGFLYQQDKFTQPQGLGFSDDGTNFIFVTDISTDSLYVFQSNGFEGVPPPAGSNELKPIVVSFGGEGVGPRQFNNPVAVAYFRQVVYVVDQGNNRIARYKLNTDFE